MEKWPQIKGKSSKMITGIPENRFSFPGMTKSLRFPGIGNGNSREPNPISVPFLDL